MIFEIKNINVKANLKKHYFWETSDIQDIILDIKAEYNLENAFYLNDVVDYVEVENLILNIVKDNHFEIIEHLGNELCDKILSTFLKIEKISVQISKINLMKNAEKVSVCISKHNPKNLVIIAIGSNLGDRLANLKAASKHIVSFLKLTCVKFSSIYQSKAYLEQNSPKEWDLPYYNAAISGHCDANLLNSLNIIEKLQEIEQKMGMPSTREKNSPRIVDLDLIYYSGKIVSFKNLQVPHPQIYYRDFALIPALEIESELIETDIKNNCQVVYDKNIWNN